MNTDVSVCINADFTALTISFVFFGEEVQLNGKYECLRDYWIVWGRRVGKL